jgi:hypothetical protein
MRPGTLNSRSQLGIVVQPAHLINNTVLFPCFFGVSEFNPAVAILLSIAW